MPSTFFLSLFTTRTYNTVNIRAYSTFKKALYSTVYGIVYNIVYTIGFSTSPKGRKGSVPCGLIHISQ